MEASRRRISLAARKYTTRFAGMSTGVRVFGLYPTLALRRRTWKLPKPRTSILSPRTSAAVMASKTACTTVAALSCGILKRVANSPARTALFTRASFEDASGLARLIDRFGISRAALRGPHGPCDDSVMRAERSGNSSQ